MYYFFKLSSQLVRIKIFASYQFSLKVSHTSRMTLAPKQLFNLLSCFIDNTPISYHHQVLLIFWISWILVLLYISWTMLVMMGGYSLGVISFLIPLIVSSLCGNVICRGYTNGYAVPSRRAYMFEWFKSLLIEWIHRQVGLEPDLPEEDIELLFSQYLVYRFVPYAFIMVNMVIYTGCTKIFYQFDFKVHGDP